MERSTYSSAETSTVGPSSLKHGLDHSTHSPQRPSKIARNCDQAATIAKEDNLGEGVEEEGDEGSMSMARESMNNLQPNRSQRYLVAIEYVGTRFYGSQKQPTFRTVVGVLEEAFEKFIGKPVSVFCSSRTDAGVHALSNVCHIDVERISKRKPGEVLPPHEPSVVRRAVNHFLQKSAPDVMVIDVRRVPPDFHARYKAQERIYFYRLLSGPEPSSSFEKDRAWHVPEDLNLCAMQEACKVLIGRHDFSSFRASGCQADSPVRTLEELSVSESVSAPYFPSDMVMQKDNAKDEKIACTSMNNDDGSCSNGSSSGVFGVRRGHRCLVIKARARSFLYHQVRLLVGVLKAVGTGDINCSDVQRILDSKNVTAAKPMAPSCGLYLGQVKYDLP